MKTHRRYKAVRIAPNAFGLARGDWYMGSVEWDEEGRMGVSGRLPEGMAAAMQAKIDAVRRLQDAGVWGEVCRLMEPIEGEGWEVVPWEI